MCNKFWNVFTRRYLNGAFILEPLFESQHTLTFRLIEWLAVARCKTSADILKDFETFVVSERHGEELRSLIRFGGANFVESVFSHDQLDERSEIALTGLNVPA